MKCDDYKQAPGLHASPTIIEARHRGCYDHSIIGQADYQQHQENHDLADELQKLAELKDVAVCAVCHLDVLLVKESRHTRLADD